MYFKIPMNLINVFKYMYRPWNTLQLYISFHTPYGIYDIQHISCMEQYVSFMIRYVFQFSHAIRYIFIQYDTLSWTT